MSEADLENIIDELENEVADLKNTIENLETELEDYRRREGKND